MLNRIKPDPEIKQTITLAPAHGKDREEWLSHRDKMESSGRLRSRVGERPQRIMSLRRRLFRFFHLGSAPIYIPFLHNYLMARTSRLKMSEHDIAIKNLPPEFENYRILHLSDLHFGGVAGLEASLLNILSGVKADLIVLTGDYLDGFNDSPKNMRAPLQNIIDTVEISDGILAVLGNHDSWRSVEILESLGMHVLVNETAFVGRHKSQLTFTGTDDPSYYFTENAVHSLSNTEGNCRIALCHSSELADIAATNGFSLYLSGHTHGGQICLPGGKALHVDLQCFPKYHEGLWFHGEMVGYTSIGAGASILPYRFFKQAEISMLRLRSSYNAEQ